MEFLTTAVVRWTGCPHQKQLYRPTVKAVDYDPYREMKSLPAQFAPWDLIPENKWSQWRETNTFLILFELCNELHI